MITKTIKIRNSAMTRNILRAGEERREIRENADRMRKDKWPRESASAPTRGSGSGILRSAFLLAQHQMLDILAQRLQFILSLIFNRRLSGNPVYSAPYPSARTGRT